MDSRPPSRPPENSLLLISTIDTRQPVDVSVMSSEALTAVVPVSSAQSEPAYSTLDPNASPFAIRNSDLVHKGILVPDLNSDWEAVQRAHGGMSDVSSVIDYTAWGNLSQSTAVLQDSPRATTVPSSPDCLLVEPLMPLPILEDAIETGFGVPAKPVMKVNSLQDRNVHVPSGIFTDKVLPPTSHILVPREIFTSDYFVSLHNVVSAPGIRADGSRYPSFTPNYLGARVKLAHTCLKPERWRIHLFGYEHADIVQHLEYGFPLGLSELPEL